MASLFASNKILPNLKRRGRSSNKSDASPAKSNSKVLHILPNVAEEDESPSRTSCSSSHSLPTNTNFQPSRYVNSSATIGARPTHDKRDSRRVVLTGVEGLTFDDFFPPSGAPRTRTPSPPPRVRSPSPLSRPSTPPRSAAPSSTSESSLDDINLRFSGLGISLDFPSPPSSAATFASLARRREPSPSPSVASSDCTSSPKTPCSTPPTSDDESPIRSHLMRAPTFKSQHASVLFVQPTPNMGEPVRKSSIVSIIDDNVSEEVDWIAQDISDIITLSSPLPPAFRVVDSDASVDVRARPDSMPPPPRATRPRDSKAPPVPRISVQDSSLRGPSAQLDPTFPLKRRSYLVPTRPPPPPPVSSSSLSAMEQATEDLLAELANAALGAGFLGTELTIPYDRCPSPSSVPPSPSSHFIVMSPTSCDVGARPPPRSSVPADVDFPLDVESPTELLPVRPDRDLPQWPSTPMSASVYSQASAISTPSSPLSSFDFDLSVAPESPRSPMHRTASTVSLVGTVADAEAAAERVLRSRWSTSTLGSLAESHSHSWLPRFTLSPSKRGKGKVASSSSHSHSSSNASATSVASSPLQRKNAVKGPMGAAKRSLDSERGLSRRDSRSSQSSASDSGESTASSGLHRKPIPMALLAMSGSQHSITM